MSERPALLTVAGVSGVPGRTAPRAVVVEFDEERANATIPHRSLVERPVSLRMVIAKPPNVRRTLVQVALDT